MGYEAFIQAVLEKETELFPSAMQLARSRLSWLIDLAVEYYWEQDAAQRFTYVNHSRFGEDLEGTCHYLGRTFWELDEASVASLPVWQQYQDSFTNRDPIRNFTVLHCDESRGNYYLSISGVPRFDASGNFLGYCGIVRDVTLEQQNQVHAESLELAAIGIAHVGAGGRILYGNHKLCEMLGYSVEELCSLTVKQISHSTDADTTDTARAELRAGLIDSFKHEKRYVRKDGSLLWVGLTVAAKRDAHGCELYNVSIVEDISSRKEAEARVEYLATHDEMTGLPNRALLNQLLKLALETGKRYQRKTAIIVINLDRFKQINDSLGHEAGDDLLKQMVTRFKAAIRAVDVVARLGSDEFVVLVQEFSSTQQVAAIARNLLATAAQSMTIQGHECRVTASAGISVYSANGEDDDQALIRNAGIAMTRAKEDGKNNFQFYSPDMNSHAIEHLALEAHLRHAVERCEFEVYYQPKVSIKTGKIQGAEALLRWQNPILGSVSPVQFIPIAEETGLILPIGKWVIRQSCEQLRNWDAMGLPAMCMAVNLSPRQFADPELLPLITQVLQDTAIAPQRLELEITESMVMNNAERALEKLHEIKALGIRIAIDDFGTGYSSLSQLKRFPVDTLKIDRSFIREVETVQEDRAITKAIITMGKTLGLTIVAEGVETAEQQLFLRNNGCDEIQGYFFSKPICAADFELLLSNYIPSPLC